MARNYKIGAPAGSNKIQAEAHEQKAASPDPSKAGSEANLSTTFGVPKETI